MAGFFNTRIKKWTPPFTSCNVRSVYNVRIPDVFFVVLLAGAILWIDEIMHHFETMGNHCWLAFTGDSSFQGFLGGAGFPPSTVGRE